MWEIYAYHNADSLFGIFNATAAIHASGDYAAALGAVAFIGFIAALLAYAFAPEKLQGWKWLGSVMLVYTVLIVPRVTVGIVDKTGSAPVKVVDHVPLGVAALGSVSSTIGHTLTGLFETAFQTIPGNGALPAELGYQQHGLMFGNRLIRDSARLVFDDPAFRTDLANFILNCTRYDLLDGTLDPTVFSTSDNVWPLMATPNPARFSSVRRNGATDIDTCPRVYQSLDGRMPQQLERLQGRLAFQLNPTLPAATAASVIADQVRQAYLRDGIADASATAASLIRQNAMINVLQDAGQLAGQQANDPAAMILAVGRAQATAQQNAIWLNYGKLAEQALPVFRNVIEAISYALFPLVVLLLMLTSGADTVRTLVGYACLLAWIQLWPPLYAILNYMASVYAAYDLAAAADIGQGVKALSLQSASPIYGSALSGEAMVGYLVITVPFLAWSVVRRMESMGTTLAASLAGVQATVAGATGAAASGNASLGNVAMDQVQLAPNRTSAFMQSRQDNLTGDTVTGNVLSGVRATSLLRNQGFASRVISARVSEQQVSEASAQVDAARTEATSAAREHSSVLSNAFMQGLSRHQSTSRTTSTGTSRYEQWGKSLDELDQISKSVASSTGATQSQVAALAFGAAASLGLGLNGPIHAGLHTEAKTNKGYMSGLSHLEQSVVNSLSNEQIARFKAFGDRVTSDSSVVRGFAENESDASDLSRRISESTAKTQRTEATLQQRSAFANRMSRAHEQGEVITIDIAQDPHNVAMFERYSRQYGGSSAAATAMIEAELARQALGPSPLSVDRDQAPASPEAVRQRHGRWLDEVSVSQSGEELAQVLGPTAPLNQSSTASKRPSIRNEVEAADVDLHRKIDLSQKEFGPKSGASLAPDGTLQSKKSLVKQSSRQVQQDAIPTGESAKEIVKELLKKSGG